MLARLILLLVGCPAYFLSSIKAADCRTRHKTLLISFDGFPLLYLQNGIGYPAFKRIMQEGVFTESFQNIFPGETFPNHFSMVTGLYAESHGLVSNLFYDPDLKKMFETPPYATERGRFLEDPVWWNAEPLWVTARRRGFAKMATSMWPGDRVAFPPGNIKPDRFRTDYDPKVSFKERSDEVLHWLLDDDIDVAFMLHFEPDNTGHHTGITGSAIERAIAGVDDDIGYLLESIDAAGFTQCLNLILVSDHAMGRITRQIVLDDYFNISESMELVSRVGAHADLWPRPGWENDVYCKLQKIAVETKGAFTVYKREDLPAVFHYSRNRRIAPIIVLGNDGTFITSDSNNDAEVISYRAIHGWDPTLPGQQPIFLARGPAFKFGGYNATLTTRGMTTKDVYAILARLLHLNFADLPANNASEALVADLFRTNY